MRAHGCARNAATTQFGNGYLLASMFVVDVSIATETGVENTDQTNPCECYRSGLLPSDNYTL